MRVQHKFLLKTDKHSLAPIISPVVDARTDSVTESVTGTVAVSGLCVTVQ